MTYQGVNGSDFLTQAEDSPMECVFAMKKDKFPQLLLVGFLPKCSRTSHRSGSSWKLAGNFIKGNEAWEPFCPHSVPSPAPPLTLRGVRKPREVTCFVCSSQNTVNTLEGSKNKISLLLVGMQGSLLITSSGGWTRWIDANCQDKYFWV